jgi:hypothetical protein
VSLWIGITITVFASSMCRDQLMDSALDISNYLNDVYHDWEASRDQFPKNIYLRTYWPIPFFGNPRTAIVATVGVNPSSDEFKPERNWAAVRTKGNWKKRLKNYFINATPPHKWFNSWHKGLKFLDVSYEDGTAAHIDVSYRPTRAMLKNPRTDPREFRSMVERDVAWFFRLLPLCPNLRLLLAFGPIVRKNGSTESLTQFLRNNAPKNGFTVSQDGKFWTFKHLDTGKRVCVHEVKRGLEF